MPIYRCDNCNYDTLIKTQYNRHLNTKKHLNTINKLDNKLIKILEKTEKDCEKTAKDCEKTAKDCEKTAKDCEKTAKDCEKTAKYYDKNDNKNKIKCKYCNKTFTRQNNLTIHIKNSCKNNLEREKIENKYKKELENKEKEIEYKYKKELENKKELEIKYKKEIEILHKKIEFLMEQKQGPTTIINIDKQINLNNYGSEDLSHITSGFKDNLLKVPFVAIPKMIEEVHFSDKKPENNNIKIQNKKEKYVKVYQDDKWIYKDKKSTITNLVDDKYSLIDNHYEDTKDNPKPKHVERQYEKFKELFNEGDKELHNEIRVDCELVLLNNMENKK